MFTEELNATGLVQLVLTDENGNIKLKEEHNLVVSSGLSYITSRMKDATAAAMGWMAVGTGAVAAAAANTLLGAEVARVAVTSATVVTTTVTNDSIQYVATFPAGTGTAAITEAGIFNVATANTATMLARTVFAVINKGALDTLTITWKITIA